MPQHRPPVDYDAIAASVSSDVDYDAMAQEGMAPVASHADAPETGVMSDDAWAKLSGGEKMRNVLQWGGKAIGGAFLGPSASTMVDNPKTAMAGMATGHPKVIHGLTKIAAPLATAAPAALKGMAEDPVSSLVGGYAGYQAAGWPGALAGAFGLPTGVRGLRRISGQSGKVAEQDEAWAQEAKNLNARDAYLHRQHAEAAATQAGQAKASAQAQRKSAMTQKAGWEQEARNLNTRDQFIAEAAATQADDLAVHQRMLDKIAQAKTREGIASAKQEWRDILQHARNLTEAEKATARIAADKAAQDRARELFPHGAELGPVSQRITSRTVQDGVSTTTAQSSKPALSPEAKSLLEGLLPKMDAAKGIGVKEGLMARARYLSNKLILTPAEQRELAFLNQRAGVSASEVGMTYAASGRPK